RRNIQKVIVALLGAMDRYRAYLVPGEPAPGSERAVIEQAAARARTVLGEDEDLSATLETVVALACGDEIGSPGRTAGAERAALTEQPLEWALTVQALDHATAASRGDQVDGAIELLLWQTLAACWELPGSGAAPITAERLEGYLSKAMREAKLHTTWTEQDHEYEQQVQDLGRAALASSEVSRILEEWTRRTLVSQRSAILGQKLIQLTMPGVPDVYQGNESVDFSLVDPDNRREVDHRAHAERLDRMIEGA